jgi:hypothetical protein
MIDELKGSGRKQSWHNRHYFLVSWVGATIGLFYQLRMIDDDECGAVGGMRIGRGNRTTRRKPAPLPLCPPQIPHDLTCARTRAAAVRSRRLTSWAMARPNRHFVEGLRKATQTSATVVGYPAEIRTENFLNMSSARYRRVNPFGFCR